MKPEPFDKRQCLRRNRLTAARGSVEGVPLRFLSSAPSANARKGALVDRHGAMPEGDDALAAINARLPAGAPQLEEKDVYVHYIEAANGSFLSDRFAFLATSTLVNIAKGGEAGVAFMNSHRTGDVSTPSELPFGKTFAGSYEATMEDGAVVERAFLGFYMLRGIVPNGSNGPSTDDLNRMILGGSLFDVSVGLSPGARGQATCDVCDQPYRSCPHYAGSNREMTMEDQESSVGRGVPGGQATYRFEQYELGEVSGVYDGAVPGAGFSKGLSMFDALSDEERDQFREAFRSLLADDGAAPSRHKPSQKPGKHGPAGHDKPPTGAATTGQNTTMNPFEKLKAWLAGNPEQAQVAGVSAADIDAEIRSLQASAAQNGTTLPSDIQARLATIQAQTEGVARSMLAREAASFAEEIVRSGRADPVERDGIAALFSQAALSDGNGQVIIENGAIKLGATGSAVKLAYEGRPPHRRFVGEIPGADPKARQAAAVGSYLGATPEGKTLLAQAEGK